VAAWGGRHRDASLEVVRQAAADSEFAARLLGSLE
jgi:hypothetical protein